MISLFRRGLALYDTCHRFAVASMLCMEGGFFKNEELRSDGGGEREEGRALVCSTKRVMNIKDRGRKRKEEEEEEERLELLASEKEDGYVRHYFRYSFCPST